MTTQNHIEALRRRHRELERQLEEELRHKVNNDLVITALKRRKLEVKDELAKFEHSAA